ncbi:hypothetical protein KGO95_02175 [Patescibacteria group bacterium]|nr:hypothetical protein [Patescibacteria group bacterium]
MNKSDQALALYLKDEIDAVLTKDFERQARICRDMYAPVSGLVHITVLIPDRKLSKISKEVAAEIERLYALKGQNIRFTVSDEKTMRWPHSLWFLKKDNSGVEFTVMLLGQRYTDRFLTRLKKEVDSCLKDSRFLRAGNSSHIVGLYRREYDLITPLQMERLAAMYRKKWKCVEAKIKISDFGDASPKLYLGNRNGLHTFLFS